MADVGLIAQFKGKGAELSSGRRMLVSAFVIFILCLLCAPFFSDRLTKDAPHVERGEISFAAMKALTKPVELSGRWSFEWQSSLGSAPAGTVPRFEMKVPGVWNGVVAPTKIALPNNGVVVYRVMLKDLAPGRYRIAIPTIFAANEVMLDGKIVSKRGIVGFTPETTRYYWRAQDVGFDADGKDIELAIRMASQLHRDNGFDSAPAIGLAEAIQTWTALKLSQEFLVQLSLLLLALFCLVVFLYRTSDRSFLYFSVASFLLMPASLMLGFDNLLLMMFPRFEFGAMLPFVYLCALGSLLTVMTYVHTIFPSESPVRAFRFLMVTVLIFTIVQAISFLFGTRLGSEVNVYLIPIMLITFSYMTYVITRAVFKKRDGSLPFLIGLGIFFVSLMLVGVVASGLISRDWTAGVSNIAFGVLIMLFSHIVVLAERWSRSISLSEAMTDDLRQLLEVNSSITSEMELEALLTRIVEVTSRILRAERSSLFLLDEKTNELWALVAEGEATRKIRFAADRGIAGHCFTSGQPVIEADAYANPNFYRSVDEQTGFHTRNSIAMPIITRDGRKLGVMQALNRLNDEAFTQTDLERMRAFAAQAAIALDNATLFTEVVAARNYNDSILRSMSSGVITLDSDARVAKLNEAAARMLQVTETGFQGADLRAALSATNPWIIAEIELVMESGTPRSLLDVDVITNNEGRISANVTIIPLKGDTERVGLLILIEDISEGKRVEGAMRRFMPQQVVNEVLGRGDDLMFGTAIPASVLFADIRGFTSIAEALSPRETVDMLNEVFTDLFEAVASTHGMIDKYMGDAIMAVYGAPLPGQNDAVNAVTGAVEMIRMIDALNGRRKLRGETALRLGIGIASGEVVAGTIGSPKRMDYTVIGDSVNLAARLQDATKIYKVHTIICENTAAKVGVPLRELDQIRVRGRQQPAKIFEVINPNITPAALVNHYHQGRACLAKRNWDDAVKAFEAALTLRPDDGAAALMLERATAARTTPPAADWDGVW